MRTQATLSIYRLLVAALAVMLLPSALGVLGANAGAVANALETQKKALPIFKAAPIYPRRAWTRGVEGHVLLEFVVTSKGAVRDPVVIESKPPGIFDSAAIDAALQFKYKPKVVNGEPVEVGGVRNLIKFELQD